MHSCKLHLENLISELRCKLLLILLLYEGVGGSFLYSSVELDIFVQFHMQSIVNHNFNQILGVKKRKRKEIVVEC